jgi:hypothetical protein
MDLLVHGLRVLKIFMQAKVTLIMLLYWHGVFIAIILLYPIFKKIFILIQKNLLFIISNLLIKFLFLLHFLAYLESDS